MKKNQFIKIICLVFALVLCANLSVFALTEAESANDDTSFNITELDTKQETRRNIPLLIILINYDANGNGVNDYDTSNTRKLFSDSTAPYYGEQWTSSSHKDWANRGFGTSQSVASYYKELTEGNFTFTPCPETCADVQKGGVANDGVIEVTVPYKHPEAATGSNSGEDTTSRKAVLMEASKYVDFKALDVDNNNKLSQYELAIAYITSGAEESSSTSFGDRNHFGVHAHYTGGAGVLIDGLTVGTAGFIRVGEYTSKNSVAAVGVIAHELGHFLGAPDLYDTTKSSSKWNYVGNMSLMASGSWCEYNGLRGNGAAYLDPWNLEVCSLYYPTIVTEDGEYTLYNRQASKPYNYLKVYTPNPEEYYLIENRYSNSSATQYDKIGSNNQGILIWHIDETACRSGKPNSKDNSGAIVHEPGVTLYNRNQITSSYVGWQEGYVFESSGKQYKFPLSQSCYTLLTEEQAKDFNLKITILSKAGNEMKIKIEGTVAMPPQGIVTASDITTTTANLNGRITELNNGNCTKAGFIISKNSNPTVENGRVFECVPGSDGKFSAFVEDLEPNTKYFCKIYLEGDNGRFESSNVFYTESIKKERTDYYVVFLYKGLTDVERSYEVKVKPGATLSYNFPMQKRGYTFCGWYLDADFTNRYDMGFTQTKCDDFSLYGKWVEDTNVATLKLVGAESKYMYFPCEVGTTFAYVTPQERDGYTFDGWYMDPEFKNLADFDQIIPDAEEYTIYAKWLKDASEPEITTQIPETTVLPETTLPPDTTQVTPEESTTTTTVTPQDDVNINLTLIIIIAVILLGILVVVVLLITHNKKKKE